MNYDEISRITKQFQAGRWPQFLEMLQIDGLRGWTGQAVNFQFPIVAIVGENGSGKSTVLRTAASAYKNSDLAKAYYPSTFFVSTHWDTIENVSLSYRVRLGDATRTYRIRKPARRWSFPEGRPKRNIFFFDISRTLPLDASAGYAKIAKSSAGDIASDIISPDFRGRLSYILGREYLDARFVKPDIDQSREVGLLRREFGEVSQFHLGAGEDTTLDIFRIMQSIPDYSLLIIDEVEASLHPKAQRRLVSFLLWLCRQKQIQIILSSHSPYILQELPPEARILLLRGQTGIEIVYGITPEFALSHIDDDTHPELHIFVEDKEASILLREIVVSHGQGGEILPRISIWEAGPANAVKTLGQLANSHRLPYPAASVLDGDQEDDENCIKLPGNGPPERVIFEDLRQANWPGLPERFGIGAGRLFDCLQNAMLHPDHHKWPELVGDQILKSATSVWEILAAEWCRSCLSDAERDRIIQQVLERIN